jgi:hypothetical protein
MQLTKHWTYGYDKIRQAGAFILKFLHGKAWNFRIQQKRNEDDRVAHARREELRDSSRIGSIDPLREQSDVADIPQGGSGRCCAADALGDQEWDGRSVATGDGGNAGDRRSKAVQGEDQARAVATGGMAADQLEGY